METTMNPSDIKRLFHNYGAEVILETGEVLFHQGDVSDAVYYVLSGGLTVHVKEGDADPVLLNCIEAGELVGELGAITLEPRSATLIAASRVVLSRIPTMQFRALLTDTLSLVETMAATTRGHLISADTARIHLGHTYQQMQKRVTSLGEEKEQLQELLHLREELESMVVHDLRNPLHIVNMGLSLLEPMQDQVKDREAFMLITSLAKGATQRMQQLISTLLDIARLESGKLVLNFTEFDLSTMLKELVATQQATITRPGVEIVTQMPPELLMRADRDILWRIGTNLLDNALKFAPAPSKVEVATRSLNNQAVRITVTDAGPGVPPEDRERIFEKFTQVNDAVHKGRGGTGLGLTFCRMAVEAHGGSIWVDAGPLGVGSCFHVQLPQH